jgi:16S rRNA C1402 (ribose-2'-O) methylase RsmI
MGTLSIVATPIGNLEECDQQEYCFQEEEQTRESDCED